MICLHPKVPFSRYRTGNIQKGARRSIPRHNTQDIASHDQAKTESRSGDTSSQSTAPCPQSRLNKDKLATVLDKIDNPRPSSNCLTTSPEPELDSETLRPLARDISKIRSSYSGNLRNAQTIFLSQSTNLDRAAERNRHDPDSQPARTVQQSVASDVQLQ